MTPNTARQSTCWIQNLFKVSLGASGKRFFSELACFIEAFVKESAFEAFTLKTVMTMPALVLQKPNAKFKTDDHISCLLRRLSLWEKGKLLSFSKREGIIQRSLQVSSLRRDSEDEAKTACKFVNLMMEGKGWSAWLFGY